MKQYAESVGLSEEGLDELVHDFKSGEAAQINNDGVDSQLEYLLDQVTVDELKEEILQVIKDAEWGL